MHFSGSILIWPMSMHDNKTSATINGAWVWLLIFCAGELKTASSCLDVAVGIDLHGRLRVGVSGGAAMG